MAERKKTNESTPDNQEILVLSYNPFTFETKLEGIEKKDDSKIEAFFKKNKNTRIQVWIEQFFFILEEELNTKSFLINFKGREEEYDDLKEISLILNNKEWDIKITLEVTHKNNKEIFKYLDEFIENLKKDAPKELQEKLQENNVYKEYLESKNTEAYIGVVATMSSGKSTLINSILGEELLPSKNEACTSNIFKIKDIDGRTSFRAKAEDLNGNMEVAWHENIERDFLEELNEKGHQKGLNVFIEGDVPNISSENMNLVIVDTPGPNNSKTSEHQKTTYKYIEDNETNPLILYVINATQQGTSDDEKLLEKIGKIIKDKGKQMEDRFLFVLNKIDAFDIERENIEELVENNIEYLKDKGIKNPKIFPVSAEFAKLKKLELKNKTLTRSQRGDLRNYKDKFMPEIDENYEGINTIKYASISHKIKEELYLDAQKNEDTGHLNYSGISAIEKYIDIYISKYLKTQKIKECILTLKDILDENYNYYSLLSSKSKEELTLIQEDLKLLKESQMNFNEKKLNDLEAKYKESLANQKGTNVWDIGYTLINKVFKEEEHVQEDLKEDNNEPLSISNFLSFKVDSWDMMNNPAIKKVEERKKTEEIVMNILVDSIKDFTRNKNKTEKPNLEGLSNTKQELQESINKSIEELERKIKEELKAKEQNDLSKQNIDKITSYKKRLDEILTV